jgi:putative tryptophan/tyrosine transport system substrate-binding protein
MRRREFVFALGGAAAWPLAARAQQPAAPVIGFLSTYQLSGVRPLVSAFRKGLAEVGYVEGQNVRVEYRWAENHYDRLTELAKDLAHRKVAVIVTSGGEVSALAAKSATATIPIVFNSNSDPVRLGLVTSLNRPGGNLTGVSLLTTESVVGKRIDLLHTLLPKADLFGMLVNAKSVSAENEARAAEAAVKVTGNRFILRSVDPERDLDTAFVAFVQQRIDGLVVQSDPLFFNLRDQLITLAAHHGVPAIYGRREIAAAGGLMTYGSDLSDAYRQQGVYAGRILKGQKPADLPVWQPLVFEVVINLKTAKALGIEVPDRLLALADEVIE